MRTIVVLLSLFAISHAATILPVDSSIVSVKSEHAGQDYSYSIQENHGLAVHHPGGVVHPALPVIKTIVPEIHQATILHGSEQIHPEGHQQVVQHEIRPQSVAKAAPIVPEHSVVVGSYPSSYLGYLPISYQYGSGLPYGYTYPSNILAYRLA